MVRRWLKQLQVQKVILNGPRYWTMDEITGRGTSISGKPETIGGITMAQRATLTLTKLQLFTQDKPYITHTINRSTTYKFLAGKKVYTLIGPKGDNYIMQSYAQIVDSKLNLKDLDNLQTKLSLPAGWKYKVEVLQQDLLLTTKNGKATVIQDNLKNTYQQM